MNKSEALKVMHEVLDVFKESILLNHVSLDHTSKMAHQSESYYVVKMKCELDIQSRESLQSILDKHRLLIREEQDVVTIYGHPS